MNIRTNRKGGFTLVEIMITVAIIGMLSAIGVPNFLKSRDTSQLNTIISNLRLIESTKQQWALDTRQGNGALATDPELASYLRGNTMPTPVVGETYNINPVGTPADATTPVRLGTIPAGGTVTLP
jgi:prepilin-type N-terminal cleavage/methylation domain-containing protein